MVVRYPTKVTATKPFDNVFPTVPSQMQRPTLRVPTPKEAIVWPTVFASTVLPTLTVALETPGEVTWVPLFSVMPSLVSASTVTPMLTLVILKEVVHLDKTVKRMELAFLAQPLPTLVLMMEGPLVDKPCATQLLVSVVPLVRVTLEHLPATTVWPPLATATRTAFVVLVQVVDTPVVRPTMDLHQWDPTLSVMLPLVFALIHTTVCPR